MNTLLVLPLLLLPLAPSDALDLFLQWRKSPSAELRIQAVRSLRGRDGPKSRVALLSLLGDDDAGVRAAVRYELTLRPPGEGPDLAHDIAALRDPRARHEGLRVVLARKEDATRFASDRDADVRARALAQGRVVRPALEAALRQRDARTRAFALEALGDPALARARLRDRAEEVRIAAARVVDDAPSVARLLRDASWRVRLAALQAAERLRSAELVPALIEALDERPGRVQARAVDTLEGLTRILYGADVARWRRWWARHGGTFTLPPPRKAPREEHTAARITFRRIPVTSRRLCFVIDASRSMNEPAPGKDGRSRWDLVVRDLAAVLERLPSDARFNVILFRTGVEAWRPRLVPATRGARRACLDWITDASPAGWTNLFDALALALEDDDVDALYVLTDGVPSRGAETKRAGILAEIDFLNHFRVVQVNCVQAGSSEGLGRRWRGFLDELAHSHDGIAVRE